MTFDEWWKTHATDCEIPQKGHTHSLIKGIASAAWRRGYSEARKAPPKQVWHFIPKGQDR